MPLVPADREAARRPPSFIGLRTRATKAEVEARREALLDIIAVGRPMTVRGAAAADAGKESVRPPTRS
jgi:hypothetical protein